MLTSIVLLTYNKLEYTKMCIDSIRKYTPKGLYELIVVDNASTDGTREWLKTQPDIYTILNKENLGFPKGCNQGIEVAGGDSVLLLNNDTIVTHHWLENLRMGLFSDESIGAVGAVTNSCSYYQAIPVEYKDIEQMHQFAKNYNVSNPNQWEERLKLIGFCMLIKKSIIEQIGMLDERFTPGNFEDDDYSLRIRLAGYKLMLLKDTFIHHFGSVSFGENASKFSSVLQINKRKFKEKWGFDPHYSTAVRNEIIKLIDSPLDQNIKVLEIGCACGGTLLKIKDIYKHASLYGIELNDSAAKSAQLFAHVKSENIETSELSYELGYFDYIIVADVLEHLVDPWRTVATLKKYLKPDGVIFASIPNVMHFSVVRNLLNGRWQYEDDGILDRTHLRFFTLFEIQSMFKSVGFNDLQIGTVVVRTSAEEEKLIEQLSQISSPDLVKQFRAFQYIIKASTNNQNSELDDLIRELSLSEEGNEEALDQINKYETFEILKRVSLFTGDRGKVLNQIAINNYAKGLNDRILPFLAAAYEIDKNDQDTLYNLAYVLNVMGEKDLALRYLDEMIVKDDAAQELYVEIQSRVVSEQQATPQPVGEPVQTDDRERELSYLLRRFEVGIAEDEDVQTLLDYLNDASLEDNIFITVVNRDMIKQVPLLNMLAISCFENGLQERIIPFLQAAFELDQTDRDTLYNLAFILNQLGEREMALEFLNKIKDKDQEVLELISEVGGE